MVSNRLKGNIKKGDINKMGNQKYTGVKFYFRDINRWGNFLKLNVGFDVSFVQDKTTDSANISFIVQDEPDYFTINTWAALFIGADSPELEFNKDGTPKNHEQFIIGGYQYYKTLAGYQVTMKLIEPIERFRGVLGETLSYTNQTSKVQDEITYVKEPYNFYTALKRWLQVTPANTDNISRDGDNKDPNGIAWWNRITILDKDFLSGLPFADDTLNELSLYDLLLDVYDSGTGRTPIAYFDLNTTTGMPKRLDRDEYLLKFIRQDGADKPILEWDSLTENKGSGEVCTGVMKREDGANYATGLVANVTNLSPNTAVTFPAQGVYAVPEVLIEDARNTTGYTETGKGVWGLVLPHKIKQIKQIKQLAVKGYENERKEIGIPNIKGYNINRKIEELEIMERKQRSVLELDVQKTISYFDEGENIIYLSDYAYKQPNKSKPVDSTMNSIFYYVEYEPLIDARVQLGEGEYIQQINQTASQVDSNKFGKFMENYLAGMGKADCIIQRTTENPQEYINHIGNRVKRKDKEYLITNVSFRNRNFQYDVFFQLNESHMRKNMSYLAPQNIRANTSIQYDNILDREINIKETFKIGLQPINNHLKYLKNIQYLVSMLGLSTEQNFYPQFANIRNQGKLIKSNGEIKNFDESRSTNIATFVTANQVCINIKFLNNALAGTTKDIYSWSSGDDQMNWLNPFNRVDKQHPVLYTDAFGEVEKTSIDLVSIVGTNLTDIDIGTDASFSEEIKKEYENTKSFQKSMSELFRKSVNVDKKIISITNLNMQKDMHEDYNITYQAGLESDENIIIYPDFLVYSRLAYNGQYLGQINIELYKDFDKIDLLRNINNVSTTTGDNYIQYSFTENTNPKSILIKYKFSDPNDKEVDLLLINNYNNEDWRKGFRIYY